jgi:hypothetical protein
MGCQDNSTLLQYEPIVEAIMVMGWAPDGWEIIVTHRHSAGRFGACGRDVYEHLTLDELVDVVAATTSTYGPFASPNGLD